MKRWMTLWALLCLLWEQSALAEWALPQEVGALCASRYPGYDVAAYDGWGDETQGQVALVLSREGDNVLCIAEKAAGDEAYAFTVENTNAVREGEDIPRLLIDTGGDVLYFAYHDGGQSTADYRSVKADGMWGRPTVIHLDMTNEAYDLDMQIWVNDGYLRYQTERFDKLENRMDGSDLAQPAPVPVSEGYVESLALATFDIDAISLTPWTMDVWPGLCDGLLEDGDELLSLDVQETSILMLVRKRDGAKRLRLANWNGRNYAVEETGSLPEDAHLDSFHMGEGDLFIVTEGGACYHNFTKRGNGTWTFSSVQAEESFVVGYDSINDFENYAVLQNVGVVYGETPWRADVTQLDLTRLPRTFEEATAQMDRSVYAVVNNPDPADRLNLRAKPDKGAKSLGKFYNRTPVYVLETRGDWAHVRIGSEAEGLEGWMMKKFLAFGDGMDDVACAFPQLMIGSPENDRASLALLSAPQKGASIAAQIDGSTGAYIVGAVGNEWFILLTPDGAVGYAAQSAFWAGNG